MYDLDIAFDGNDHKTDVSVVHTKDLEMSISVTVLSNIVYRVCIVYGYSTSSSILLKTTD